MIGANEAQVVAPGVSLAKGGTQTFYANGLLGPAKNFAIFDTSPRSWDGRIDSDFADRSLPTSWREISWSVRLGSSFDTLHYHVSLKVDQDGRISSGIVDPGHADYLDRIRKIYGTRITVSFIGEEKVFLPIAEDSVLRENFVDSLETLCETMGFQGVDMDWEFPGIPRAELRKAYTQLVRALVERLSRRNIEVSVAVSRWRPLDADIFELVDKVHLMAYDGYGRHSTYEGTVSDAEYFVSRYSIDRSKVTLGLPYYGRIWDPSQEDYWKETRNYREIIEEWQPERSTDEAGFFYFNGPDTITRKTRWAAENGFAGIYVWEPFYDIRGNASLTTAILSAIETK